MTIEQEKRAIKILKPLILEIKRELKENTSKSELLTKIKVFSAFLLELKEDVLNGNIFESEYDELYQLLNKFHRGIEDRAA